MAEKIKALKSSYKDLDKTPYYCPTAWTVVAYDENHKEVCYSYVGDRHFDEAWRDLMKENPDLRSKIKRMYVDHAAAKEASKKQTQMAAVSMAPTPKIATRIRKIAEELIAPETAHERKYYRYGLQEGKNAIYIGDKTDDELRLSFEEDKTRGIVQQILDHWKRTTGTVYRDPSLQPEEIKAFEEGFVEGFRTEAEKLLRKKQLI